MLIIRLDRSVAKQTHKHPSTAANIFSGHLDVISTFNYKYN